MKPQAGESKGAIAELQGQLKAQSVLVADQQRRIEELEVKLAALAAKVSEKAKAPPAAAASPARAEAAEPAANAVIEFDGSGAAARGAKDPRHKLQTVRLEPAQGRRARRSPVDRAPRLPTITNLKEPDEGELQRLEEAAEARPSRRSADVARDAAQADQAFARAVQRLNEGDRTGAHDDLLRFAASHPQHAAADNAIELAGVARAQKGDCAGALPLFDRVTAEYPAGDAVPAARLEAARCLLRLGRTDEAKAALTAVEKDYPDVPEASQARAVLNGL